MNAPAPVFPGWEGLRAALSATALTPAGQLRARHFQPAFERSAIEMRQREYALAQRIPPGGFAALQSLQTPAVHTLLTALEKPPHSLPLTQLQAWPVVVTALKQLHTLFQPIPELRSLLTDLQAPEDFQAALNPSLPEQARQRLLNRRWREIQRLGHALGELDWLQARYRFGQSLCGQFAQFSQHTEIHLPHLRTLPSALAGKPALRGDLHWPGHSPVWLLNGPHGSGKTDLLLNLGLNVLMHQAGLPILAESGSRLPVFASVRYLEGSGTPIATQLRELQPLLRKTRGHQLLLLDNPLASSHPQESTALLKSLIRYLAGTPCKLLMVTHNPQLGTLLEADKGIEQIHLKRQKTHWQLERQGITSSELLPLARAAGWPGELLQQASETLSKLTTVTAPPVQPPARHPLQPPPTPVQSEAAGELILSPGVRVGVRVYVQNATLRSYGDLESLPDKQGKVGAFVDNKTWIVPARDVVLSSHKKEKRGDHTGIRIVTWSRPEAQCDLHGLRLEEARFRLEKFLDTAQLGQLTQVRIVHGKGSGQLRQMVHAFLTRAPGVRAFRQAEYSQGDSGVTLVDLN